MYSRLKPDVLYTDISPDITETDVDVVSDLWNMDGRDVYRGARDPRYTHANVYWLYDEDLQRVGCSEHALDDHADVRLLWFQESAFGTLFQEEGWVVDGELWTRLPNAPFERFINEGWTTVESVLEQCLHGPFRILTPQMLIKRPTMYHCTHCGKRSLRWSPYCAMVETELDIPQLEKVLFVDDELVVHVPPPDSVVFTRLQPQRDDGSQPASQQQPVLAQEPEARSATPQPVHPPQTPAETLQAQEPEPTSPPQSHPRTPEQPSGAEEAQPERA